MRGAPIQLLLIVDREKVDSRQAVTGSPETRLKDCLSIGVVRPVGHNQRLCIEVRLALSNARAVRLRRARGRVPDPSLVGKADYSVYTVRQASRRFWAHRPLSLTCQITPLVLSPQQSLALRPCRIRLCGLSSAPGKQTVKLRPTGLSEA